MLESDVNILPVIDKDIPIMIDLLKISYFFMSKRVNMGENTSPRDSRGVAMLMGEKAYAIYLAR